MPSDGNCWYAGVFLICGVSDGGHPVSFTSTPPELKVCSAVDPSVIPLGTRMTIPGYGEAIAADTGGAVRGSAAPLTFDDDSKVQA